MVVLTYVAFSNPNKFKSGVDRGAQFNPFGPNMISFTSSEDLMKNLSTAMGNTSKAMGGAGFPTGSPTFKISMREYEDMSIKVGDAKYSNLTRAFHSIKLLPE
jgi:hypothetical protein